MYGRRAKQPCVYMLASRRNGVLYLGVTSNLAERVSLHRQKIFDGFTARYGVRSLVYYEMHASMHDAIRREKQLKRWNRGWKVRLIEQMNPEWQDLWTETGEVDASGSGGQSLPEDREERMD